MRRILFRINFPLGVALVSGALGAAAAVLAVNPGLITAAKPAQQTPSGNGPAHGGHSSQTSIVLRSASSSTCTM